MNQKGFEGRILTRNRVVYIRDTLRVSPNMSASESAKSEHICRVNGNHLGDCPIDEYESQLSRKLATLQSLFPSFPAADIEVFRSPPIYHRNRANFNVWRDQRGDERPEGMYYAMWDAKESSEQSVTHGTAGMSKKQRKIARFEQKAPQKQPCEVTEFPRGTALINSLMKDVLLYLREQDPDGKSHAAKSSLLRKELFEVRFVTTQLQEAIAVLIYHCPLNAKAWCDAAMGLITWLQRPGSGCAQQPGAIKVVGRARRQKLFVSSLGSSIEDDQKDSAEKVTLENLEKELITEQYRVNGQKFRNYQIEGAFSQPNAVVCQHMLEWSVACTGTAYEHNCPGVSASEARRAKISEAALCIRTEEDLVELYCGGGTFTSPLSRNFRGVLATELSKASVVLAKKAFTDNGISNVTIAPVSAEDFSDMYLKFLASREKNVAFSGGNLGHTGSVPGITNLNIFNNISTVFVDPPRAGCDDATCALLARFDKICYISCNPETLARDVAKITAIVGPGTSSATGKDKTRLYRHKIVRMAAFDQFPYTHHLEGGVMLVKELVPDALEPIVGAKRPLDAN